MKKPMTLSTQEINKFKLSRRKFCVSGSTMLLACSSISNIAHAISVKPISPIEKTIHALNTDASTIRVGQWMKENLSTKKAQKIIGDFEQRLKLIPSLSKKMIAEMISSDYSEGHIIDVSGIRFFKVEVALCIAASTYAS